MMSKRLAADRQDNLIRVNLGRGCYLLLTWAEYTAGIERGKWERRKLSARTQTDQKRQGEAAVNDRQKQDEAEKR
jgi:hypothetical protein